MLNYVLIVVFYLQFRQSNLITFLGAFIFFLSSAIFMLVLILLFHFIYNWIYLKKLDFFTDLKVRLSNKFKKYEVVENEAREDSDVDLFQAAEERVKPVDTY